MNLGTMIIFYFGHSLKRKIGQHKNIDKKYPKGNEKK